MNESRPNKPSRPVNPALLTLARESRGMSQGQLAEAAEASQAKISKYEAGLIDVSVADLKRIGEILEYPEDFFFQTEEVYGFGSSCLYHRKRQSLPVKELKLIHAKINIMRLHFARLLANSEIEAKNEFPRMDIDEYNGSAETIAQLVRASWNLPLGPVMNLVKEVEAAGAIVFPCSFGTPKLDAVSQWPRLMPPLLFINRDIPVDRWRFTLAHELGHLIMHRAPTPNQEKEADRFASEFLMPARAIASDLESLSLAKAAQMKPYWRVSMQALIKRAFDLKKITTSRYQSLYVQLSRLGHRKNEPVPLSSEEPTVVQEVIKMHKEEFGFDISQLSRTAKSYESHFRHLFSLAEEGQLHIVS